MRRTKRFVAMMAVLVGAAIVTTTAFGQTRIDVNNPGTGGSGYEVNGGVIRIAQNGEYTLTGTTTANRVVVGAGVAATVTLENVSITSNIASPFELNNTGCNVVLKLVGNNTLVCTLPDNDVRLYAGLEVEGANTTLTIEGEGSLTATGGEGGAGIGGGITAGQVRGGNPGNIVIKSGHIIATGGIQAAGIGGGAEGNGGNITITGGHITATSSALAAGIGGGFHGIANITITGGTVVSTGGNQGAGIGTGSQLFGEGGTINISGGNITAYGGGEGAAIGGGRETTGGTINISGGTILVIGSDGDAGIGCGRATTAGAGNINISGGSIFAYTGPNAWGEAAGIGASIASGSGSGSITISGGTIIANKIGTTQNNHNTPTTVSGSSTVIVANAVNTTNFGSASVITGVDVTEALVRTMFANIPIIVSEGEGESDTIIIERPGNTVYLHDTTTVTITDPAVIIHDTLRDLTEVRDTAYFTYNIHDTTYVHDTIYKDRIVHDTLRLTLRDTVIDHITLPIRETIELPAFYDVYTIVNNVTGDESPVEDTRIDLVPVSGDEDMFYLHGIQQNVPFAIYDSSGALVLKAGKMPMQITASGVFIVAQSGKYYKFVK